MKSFPGFNINTFDLDFAKPILESFKSEDDAFKFHKLSWLNVTSASDSYQYGRYAGVENTYENLAPVVNMDSEILFRAGIIDIFLWNDYLSSDGEFNLELNNIDVAEVLIISDNPQRDAENWIPIIQSKGYTSIGCLVSSVPFKTEAVAVYPYNTNFNNDDPSTSILPLYIDTMIIGALGYTVKYDMNYTQIAMLNFLGNEVPGSELELTMGKIGNIHNMPAVGIAAIHGGALDITGIEASPSVPMIERLMFFEGTDSPRFADGDGELTVSAYDAWMDSFFNSDMQDGFGWLLKPYYVGSDGQVVRDEAVFAEKEARQDLYFKYYNLSTLIPSVRNGFGYLQLMYQLKYWLKPGDTDMAGKSEVKFKSTNISVGSIEVSKNLGNFEDWFDPNCNLFQGGGRDLTIRYIN